MPGCIEGFRGTEADILALAGPHAERVHGIPCDDEDMLAAVRRAMRPA